MSVLIEIIIAALFSVLLSTEEVETQTLENANVQEQVFLQPNFKKCN